MMKLGRHLGGGAGVLDSIAQAAEEGADALQVFPGGTLNLKLTDIPEGPKLDFAHRAMEGRHGIVHAAYAVNALSGREGVVKGQTFREASIEYLVSAMRWAEHVGFDQVVFHPASREGATKAENIALLADALGQAAGTRNCYDEIELLVEHMACGFGADYTALCDAVDSVGFTTVGICLDTTHAWASGMHVDEICKLIEADERIRAVHINPPRRASCRRGSGRDRHGSLNWTEWEIEDMHKVLSACFDRGVPTVTEAKRPYEAYDAFLAWRTVRQERVMSPGETPETHATAV